MIGSTDLSTSPTKTKSPEPSTSCNAKLSFSHCPQESPTNGIHDDRSPSPHSHSNDCNGNGSANHNDDMDTDDCVDLEENGPNPPATLEEILLFGKELHTLSQELNREHGVNDANKK